MISSSNTQPWRPLADIVLPSETDRADLAIEGIIEAVRALRLPEPFLIRLQRAITEVVDNCDSYDRNYRVLTSILLQVNLSVHALPLPVAPMAWGFFLIERRLQLVGDAEPGSRLVIELYLYLEANV